MKKAAELANFQAKGWMIMSNEMSGLLKQFREWIDFAESMREAGEARWESSLEPGKWTIRDIFSHIMLWDKLFYEEAIRNIAEDRPLTLKHVEYDAFNGEAAAFGRTLTLEALLEQTLFYRRKIIETIESLPEEKWKRNYADGDGHVFHIPQYVQDFVWHDRHHMNPIKNYLAIR